MVFHPAIYALLVGSVFISAMLCYSSYHGLRILKSWNITSGSELQLDLERRTYLISTLVTYAFAFQLIYFSLYLPPIICTPFLSAPCVRPDRST